MLFSIIDVETTGLNTTKDAPLSFTALTINDRDEIVDTNHLYIYDPNIITLNPEAEKVHGLTKEILTPHIPEFWSNVKKMFNIVSYANLIGYNSIAFDYPLISNFLRRCGLAPFELLSHLDIMQAYYPLYKKRKKLIDLCTDRKISPDLISSLTASIFACDATEAHDSRYDVVSTYLLYVFGKQGGII